MARTDTLLLDAHALGRLLGEQGLEQWWVAERLGVARRTVARWLSGAVKRISRDNLTQLARLLGVEAELVLAPAAHEVFATRADQTLAVNQLLSSEAVFAAAEQNSLYETLLRAVLHPGLSRYQRCVLYNRLLVAAAKQGKFEAGRRYAALALECARAGGDTDYIRAINTNLGALEAEAGRLAEARALLEAVLAALPEDGPPHHHVSAPTNLASLLGLLGEAEAGRAIARQAAARARAGSGRAHAMLWDALLALASLEADCGDGAAARAALVEALAIESSPPQLRRQAEARLRLALLDAEAGRAAQALASLPAELALLRQYSYVGQPPQLAAARICRLAGRYAEARELLAEGLAAATTRAYEVPLLVAEQAQLERSTGDLARARRLLSRARRLMTACGMQARAARLG